MNHRRTARSRIAGQCLGAGVLVALPAVAALSGGAWGCGAQTGREVFESDVAPLLEGHCLGTACHGVAQDAEARGEVIDWTHFNVRVMQDGRIADMDRAYATAKARINTLERAELSTLLRKPLARVAGGLPHLGGIVFATRGNPSYASLLHWVTTETGGGEGKRFTDLTPNQQRFAIDVLPALATRQCMNAPCHGASAPFTAFEPPMELDGKLVFSADAIVTDYLAARMHLYLAGDPVQSRLVRKGLPLDRGGIVHRGGNDIFFNAPGQEPRDDATVRAIVGWAEAERDVALRGASPGLRGVVFVRGPASPGLPFAHDGFSPGTDLWILEPGAAGGALRNLTASAHPEGPADLRDPAVSHDATRIVFAMRKNVGDAHNLYEIRVDGSGLRQLTHDAASLPGGGRAANVQPTYGPDGRVYFVSTRAGHLADGLAAQDAEIWAVEPESGALERITHDPAPEGTPAFIGTGKSYGTLSFTVLRGIGGRTKGVVFRTPLDHNKRYHGDPELHVHHGITPPEDIVYAARTLPDGRFVATLLDRTNAWRAGRVAVFDRQLGPERSSGTPSESSEPGQKQAFTVLDAAAAASGPSPGGAYRHPVALPDGRILVSWAPGPIDLDDPAAAPRFRLVALTLTEDRATGAPQIAKREVLLEDATDSELDAEPIAPRPVEDDPSHERAWDPSASRGTFALRHVETLEAIMSNIEPRGPKPLRTDLVYARLVESLPVTPAERLAGPISLGVHGRTQILAEVPLAGGSLALDVPANRPFRVQTLDANRMAVGAQHDRWIDVAPGQTFPGGVAPELYPSLCAGCHGSLSGNAADVGGPVPDAVSQASVTLATHAQLDPRRPLARVRVGDAPIGIDFGRDIRPLLARSCASCHRGASPAGMLDLDARATASFDTAYEALLAVGPGSVGGRKYVDEAGSSALGSYLMERLTGRELGAPRALEGSCPGVPPLSDDERLTFARWIDLGAVYRGVAP